MIFENSNGVKFKAEKVISKSKTKDTYLMRSENGRLCEFVQIEKQLPIVEQLERIGYNVY